MLVNTIRARSIVVKVGDLTKEYGIENTHYRENPKSKIIRIDIFNLSGIPYSEIQFEDGMKIYYFHPHIVSFEKL